MPQNPPSRSLGEAYVRRAQAAVLDAARRAQAIDWYEAALQADTAMRTAANVLTLGGADHLAAGMDALVEPGGIENWGDRYQADLARYRTRNQYDATHRQAARAVGQVGGAALGMAAMGPMEGGLAQAARLPGAAAMTGREAAAMLGAGGATGMGMQAISGRPSSPGDYAGAALGGLAGVAALPLGPARAGAVDAAMSTVAGDVFNGRTPDIGDVSENALLGYVFGGASGEIGRRWSNGLSRSAKGKLGDGLGALRSEQNGSTREPGLKVGEKIGDTNAKWVPDGRSGDVRFEDKFGPYARLSKNQQQARHKLGDNFILYHFLPADIGKAFGMPGAALASLAPTWNGDH